MRFSIIVTFYTGFRFGFDYETDCYPSGWTVDVTIPLISVGFGTGIYREY